MANYDNSDINRLIEKLESTGKKYDVEKIVSAYNYAKELHEGQFRVSKGMITFQNHRATSYEDYTKAMKLITTAYKELREEVSAEVFGKPLAELSDEQMQVIYRAVPMNVSEVEPKDVPARR